MEGPFFQHHVFVCLAGDNQVIPIDADLDIVKLLLLGFIKRVGKQENRSKLGDGEGRFRAREAELRISCARRVIFVTAGSSVRP